MKNMFKYAAAAVILSASLVSCELDNYDGRTPRFTAKCVTARPER